MTSFKPAVTADELFVLSDGVLCFRVFASEADAELVALDKETHMHGCKPVRFIRETVAHYDTLVRLRAAEAECVQLRRALRNAEMRPVDDAEKLAALTSAMLRAVEGAKLLTGVGSDQPMPQSALTLYRHARDHLNEALENACRAYLASLDPSHSPDPYVDPNIGSESPGATTVGLAQQHYKTINAVERSRTERDAK